MPEPPGVCVLLVFALLLAGSAGAADAGESPARYVPADVGLYIEGRHVDDILLSLTEPQAWLTLADIGGQPAGIEETAEWRRRIQQTVQMKPAEALRVLFSDQFAFVAEGPRRAQDAVLLCRPTVDTKSLLERWRAQPLPTAGRTAVYRLPNRVGLALPDGLVMFGDPNPPDGMFRHVLDFADRDRAASLANDPVYQRLLARVPESPDAVLFARLAGRRPEPATSRPTAAPAPKRVAAELPGPLRGAANILLALHRGDNMLHFSAVGDATVHHRNGRTGLKALVQRLPQRTLFAGALHLDYPTLPRSIDALPERSVLRIALRLQERSGTLQRLADALDSATCLAVGVVQPRSRTVAAPPVPAVAILVATRQPQVAAAEVDGLLKSAASIYNLMALRVGSSLALPAIERLPVGPVEASLLDLSELLRGLPGGASIAELHLCWATDGDVLILASHTDWLRQILAARHGEGPTLSGMLELGGHPIAKDTETIIAAQSGPVADLGSLWLTHLERTAPQALEESWWRARQPGGDNVRLGIDVDEDPQRKRLRVTSVALAAPAYGVLKPGDEIVGCNRYRFATSQPVREIHVAIAQRPYARWVELEIVRGGTLLRRRVPLPFVDPVQLLRRAVAIGRIAQRLVYHDDLPDESGARGFLTIELRSSQEPLFPFPLTQPVHTVGERSPSLP